MRSAAGSLDPLLGLYGDQLRVLGTGQLLQRDWLRACAELHQLADEEMMIRRFRRARYGRLRKLLPPVLETPLEREALPPGAVLQGLGIQGWDQLAELRGQGRCFYLLAECGQGLWLTDECPTVIWQQAQEMLLEPGCLTAELPARRPDQLWRAHYDQDEAGYVRLRSVEPESMKLLPQQVRH
jgi:hypothetical protein